ncbi:MAG: hypothetical protein DRH26_07545, partial [Deltaproteobacteria bacterium]
MSDGLRKRIYLAGIFLLAVTIIGTTGYYLLGKLAQPDPPWSFGDSFFMTVITITTV